MDVLLTSAARTATTTSPEQRSYWRDRGVRLFLDVTANPGAQTLTPQIQAEDPASGKWVNITTFTAMATGNATYVYELYPGAVETLTTTNLEVQGLSLPSVWRVVVTHSAGGSWTYSLGADKTS